MKRPKRRLKKQEKAKAKGKAVKKKSVGSKFFNDLAGLLGDEFMSAARRCMAVMSKPAMPLRIWILRL